MISTKEKKHAEKAVIQWNSLINTLNKKDLKIDPKRVQDYGYEGLNAIIFELNNLIEAKHPELKQDFLKILYVPVMEWQNGFLKF